MEIIWLRIKIRIISLFKKETKQDYTYVYEEDDDET